jgi:Mrp family chromosome partitioning ATPase
MPTVRLRLKSSTSYDSEAKPLPDNIVSESVHPPSERIRAHLPEVSSESLQLSSKLQALASEDDRFILIAGLNEADSSPEIAIQLAVGLSAIDGQSVLLVDANLRSPWLHQRFGFDAQPGLTNVLSTSPAVVAGAVRMVKPNLALLPVGTLRADSSLFTSTAFSELLDLELRPRYRFIIVNSAPFIQYADANLIASRADGVVITLTSGRHHRTELLDLTNELESMKSKVFGTVLCDEN